MWSKVDNGRLELSPEALEAFDRTIQGEAFTPGVNIPGVSELVEVGLLEPSPDGTILQAIDPRRVEGRLTSAWRARAWRAELRAAEVERELEPLIRMYAAQRERAPQPVEYLHGMNEIREYVDRASREANEEILTAQPGSGRSAATLEAALPLAQDQLRRGVRMQTLYQHSARFNEPTKAYVTAVTRAGGEVRTLDEFFERLFVIDRKQALLPAKQDRTVAIVVHDKALVGFLADVFDRNWQRAVQFTPASTTQASTEVMPAIHEMIKRLLVEGLTDAAIARRLGVSPRTYHNHLARIRKQMGADNRLQLGYRLAKEEQAAAASAGAVTGGTPALA
ncbi:MULTISPECIES: LuxR C-terminal-related transcriptional regulator [unclassified Streptomyces]|uniref:LuxR C-terminal-related transcriptional regulator n=1 Tax=unclassified Streptomyces TaxID=2593676 RepID=UPI0033BABF81